MFGVNRMAIMEVHCKTCGEDFGMDIGDMKYEEVVELLSKKDSFHCNAGHHMELGSPMRHWVLGKIREGSSPTEEDWMKTALERHDQLYTSDELSEKFEVTGFAYGACMAKHKATGKEVCLSFTHSPKGTRYYYGFKE